MDEYVTFSGSRIVVSSIVELTVLTSPVKHRGWGVVEALYPRTDSQVALARVRDLDGQVANLPLEWLDFHRNIPQPDPETVRKMLGVHGQAA